MAINNQIKAFYTFICESRAYEAAIKMNVVVVIVVWFVIVKIKEVNL